MNMRKDPMRLVLALLVLVLALPAGAASKRERETAAAQAEIQRASVAMTMAERAGAPTYARDLYDDASYRLRSARDNADSDKSSARQQAALSAMQARAAAEAAEKKALWASTVADARGVRDEIVNSGGTAPAVNLTVEPDTPIQRGTTSRDRVAVAEAAIISARAAGAATVDSAALREAEGSVGTAKKIAQADKNNQSADHLAYMAEMTARKLEYEARLADVQKVLPAMRLERTRLAKAASDRQAADEAARRQQAEQETAALRSQVAAQNQQLDLMRQQIAERQNAMRAEMEADRAARIAAETRLNDLTSQYQQISPTASPADLEAIQRQLNDQQMALDAIRQRELLAEQSMGTDVQQLQQALADERARGTVSQDILRQRQADIDAQQRELDRMRAERQDSEKHIAELRQQHDQAVAQVAQLQQQIAQERQKSEQVSAELQKSREELARRDEHDRLANELGRIAKTTSDTRGLVVTLPGIFFDTGKSALKPGATNTLQKIADQLRGNPNLKILVEGHTDNVGSDEANLALSTRRAEAVREALVQYGIPAAAITTSGKGESAPIATNATAAGRQQNRRVELVITQ